jgi:hypothetical protein
MDLQISHSSPAIWRRPMELQASHTFALLNLYIDNGLGCCHEPPCLILRGFPGIYVRGAKGANDGVR